MSPRLPTGTPGEFYLLLCTRCDPPPPAPIPFPTPRDRADWASEHTAATGHDEYQAWTEPR